MDTKDEMINKILELKKKKNYVIVAHNYQIPEIQDIADYTGDSLELAKICAGIDAPNILFCGVKFMAETAKILSPQKKVLLPDLSAGCPLADSITVEQIKEYKEKYKDYVFVGYVNTTAEIKTYLDYCVTSANAISIIKKIPEKNIVFVPDKNLGWWVKQNVKDKNIIVHDGGCYVHQKFTKDEVLKAKEKYKDAKVLVHPECSPDVLKEADVIASTSQMIKYAKENTNVKTFIIGTEEGHIHRLKKERPDAIFYSLGPAKICFNMKQINLEKVLKSLEEEIYEIKLDEDIIKRAKLPIDRMVSL